MTVPGGAGGAEPTGAPADAHPAPMRRAAGDVVLARFVRHGTAARLAARATVALLWRLPLDWRPHPRRLLPDTAQFHANIDSSDGQGTLEI